MILKSGICMLGLALVLLCGAEQVIAAKPQSKPKITLPAGTLTSAEIFALFNDRTVYSVTAVRGRESVSYYALNGEVRQLRNGVKRFGFWRVTDSARICLQMEDLPEKCRIVVDEKGTYKKYIVRKDGKHQHSVSYPVFREGNLLGL